MKKLIFLSSFLFVTTAFSYAQNRIMLFDDYTSGTVLLRGNRKINTFLNYDTAGQQMMYKNGNQEMILTNGYEVDTIYIGSHKFIAQNPFFLEKFEMEHGDIYVRWNLKKVNIGKKGALGMVTQAKVETLNTSEYRRGVHENVPIDVFRDENNNEYWIFRDGKPLKCKNKKSLLKMFPGKEEMIQKYIKENSLQCENVKDMLQIMDFSMSL